MLAGRTSARRETAWIVVALNPASASNSRAAAITRRLISGLRGRPLEGADISVMVG
jgi:hypothetical protein